MSEQEFTPFDVVIVGARAAGSATAIHLARRGLKVAMVDRASFPSDTLSTHVIYPNTIARLDVLGGLDAVMAHNPPPLYTSFHHQGRMWVAPHTPIEGRDYAICVRRITLDGILVERARAEGVTVLEGFTVSGLLGSGTDADPVRGVIGSRDDKTIELHAPIVVGADGVNSSVSRLLGLKRERVMPTETMLYFAYWKGAKGRNTQDFFFDSPWIHAHFPADDDHHVVTMNGPVALRSEIKDLEAFYLERLRSIPELWARLEGAEKVSRVLGSRQLDGFYRRHTGPGWALVGDAAHFKHPAGAQGIGDAFHAAEVLAGMIADGSWMTAYPAWREEDSREFYAFCNHLREAPGDGGMEVLMSAMIADTGLARRFVDVWARTALPWRDVIPFVPGLEQVTRPSVEASLAEFGLATDQPALETA